MQHRSVGRFERGDATRREQPVTGPGRHSAEPAASGSTPESGGRHAAALPVDAVDGYLPSSFAGPSAPSDGPRRRANGGPAAPTLRRRPSTGGSHSSFQPGSRPTSALAGAETFHRSPSIPDQQIAERRARQQRTAAGYAVAVLGVVTTGAILLPGQQAAARSAIGPAGTPSPTTRVSTASPSPRTVQRLSPTQSPGSCRVSPSPVRGAFGPIPHPSARATPAPAQPARRYATPGLADAPRMRPTPAPTAAPTPAPTPAPTQKEHWTQSDLAGAPVGHRRPRPSTGPSAVSSLGAAPSTPTPTPTSSPRPHSSADATPTPTPTTAPTPTRTARPRPAPSHSAAPSATPTPSATPAPSATAEPLPAAPLRSLLRRAPSSSTIRLGSGAFRFANFSDDLLGVSLGSAGIRGDGAERTILEMTPHSSTKGAHASRAKGSTNQLSLMRVSGSPALTGFTLLGTKQGHLYNGLRLSKTNGARLTDVRVKAIPGDDHVNPGETFGINDFRTSGTVYDGVEVDGAGVGATGIGTNMSNDVTIVDSYLHDNPHSAGAAFWETQGITLKHVISSDNKTGLNFERTSGHVVIERPVFHGNKVDLHIGSDRGSARYTITDPVYSGSKLRIMLQPHYMGSRNDQRRSDIRVLVHGVDRTDQVVQWVG